MAFTLPKSDPKQRIAVRRFAGTRPLQAQLDAPLTVAHLTDQHFGRVTSDELQWAAAELTNEAQPDLTVLTGDYVAHSLDYLGLLTEVIGAIRGPKVAVLGNHDHWAGARQVRCALERAGVQVLMNEATVYSLRGQSLQLVGLDDAYTGHADTGRALATMDPSLPSLGLSHIAEEADRLWGAGVSLVLSGHTHSGQITVGGLHRFMLGKLAGHRYVHGLYGCRHGERAEGAVYVSAGIGASVFGLRVGERARPEVALFELGTSAEQGLEQAPHPGRRPSDRKEQQREEAVARKRRRRDRLARRASLLTLAED
ncbi:MAG: metallophosphoesterase [Polyangiaceae bacterium]|nr:metallophosphoesterase [Polyangiaceae bacterium]